MDMDCKEKGHSTLIVGASCRLPKSKNMEEFWENLINGRDMIDKTRFPEGLYDIPPRAGIIPNIDKFDADYFGFSFEDAHDINVMLRHLLEVTHECVVDSGIAERTLKEQVTGFYCGCFLQDCDPIETSRSTPTRHCTTVPQLAGHVMSKFGWTGPSVTVDTACSASISALQMAVTDLTIGRCKFAVITGVNLILNPTNLQQMKLLGMLSPEGQSRVFDRDANGYVRAEGIVAILLTRNEPENCGRVYGTVVDVMTNCDGYTPDGITFPNGAVQRQLLRNIYKKNQVSTADIAYMEMHSTGTKAGDPVEVGSITDVLCADRSTPLLIGSVKSNMGHSEATAGLASLIKCLLVARHKVIPPQLNYNNPNPRIPEVKEKKVIIVDKPTPLPDGYICVNSFGFGGANGHLIFKPYHSPLKPSSQKFTLIKHTARSEEEAASMSSFLSEADVQCNANISQFVSMSALSHDQKRPIRGYTISGTAVKENIDKVKMLTQDRGRLKMLLDLEDFVWDKTHISPQLMEIPQFRKSIDLSQKILSENRDSKISISELMKQEEHVYPITQHNLCLAVATQIGIVDCIQESGLKIDHVAGSGLSSIVAAYVDGGLTQKQCMGIAAVIGRALEKHYPYKDDKHKIYKVHLQPETLELLGEHTQVLSCTEEGGVIRVDTPHWEETLNSIHDKGGFYQELVGMLPLYSHCVPDLNNHVKKELRSVLIHPLLSSSKFLTEDTENKGRTTSRPVLFDAEYFSQLLCNFHKHPVTHTSDMVSLKLNLGNVHVTQPLEEAGPPVIYCTAHPVSVLSMFGDIHLLGDTFDVKPLYEVSSTLDINMPSISNLVRWDHSTSWYVPQWHEYCTAVNNVGKNTTYIIKTAESDSINTALSVLLYHSWMAVVRKEQISKQMDDTGIELCNLSIPGGVNMTCDTLSHAEIQVQIHQKSFTAQKDGMVLMSGNYRIHKDSLQFPRIPGYDYDMNKNIEPSIGKDDEDTLSKSEIMWEDSWLEFMNTVLEFALQHLKGPLTRVIFNPTEHRKEVKKCANVPTVVEYYTGLCKAGSSIMIQTLVTKTTHLTSDHQKSIDISGSENTLISMIKAYTINKHQADNQDKVLLYQGEHSDTGVKVIGVVLVTANETQCQEFPVSESWTTDDMNQLIPYTIAHYIVCTVAKAGCNKRFLICPPIDTVAVYIMAIADQLGNAVFASSYDVEVRQMLDEIFPFARVLPGSRLVQNVKCLTQSEGCDVCIKFSSGGLDEYVDLIGQEGKLIQCAELQQGESFNLKFLQRNGALILPDVTNAFRNLINKSPEDIQSMLYNIQSGSISKLTEEGFPESKGLLYNLEAKFQFQHAILFSRLLSLIEEMCMSESFSEMSEEDCIAMERLQNLVSTKPTDYSLAEISPGGKYKKPFNNQLLNVAQNFTPQSCATTPDIFVVSLKGITISPPSQKKPIKALFKIEKESNRDSLKFTSTPMITVTDTDNKPDELHESYIENVAPSNMLNVKSRSTLPLLRITPGNSIPRRSKTPSQRGVDLLFRVPPPTPRTPAVRSMMTQKQVNPTLIPLNDKQGPKTIFMVHPVTGKLNLLKPLGAALPTQVFGLQRTESTPRDTLANIASYYLNSVEMKEPFGPYHIIGMSFGSIITLEMAMQIQESGREVHDLILLDGGPQYFRSQIKHDHLCTGQSDPMFEALALLVFLQLFGPIENRNLVTKVLVNLPDRAARIQTAVDMTFKMVSISSNPQQTRWMAAKLKLMKAKKPERYGIADAAQEIVRLKRIQAAEDFFAYVSMIHPFVPSERKFKGNIHLLRIKDDLPHIYEPLPTDYGLKDWCTGEVHIRFYNGDHETFMNLPEVRKEILRIFSLD